MIDPFRISDPFEFALRVESQEKDKITVSNWKEFFDIQKDSVVNLDETPEGMLKNYASKAGLRLKSVVSDYGNYVVEVEKRKRVGKYPKTSIVMSSYGHPKECKLAIDSIHKCTHVPFELIVSNNPHPNAEASEEVLQMLHQYEKDMMIDRLILNERNLGDMGALNEGMKYASGEFVCVVNNDIITCEHWLRNMLEVFIQENDCGLCSGRTRNITGVQAVFNGPPNEMVQGNQELLKYFNQVWQHQHHMGWWKFPRIRSMVMVIRKEDMDEIGGLDMRYGMGNYDDDDMCVAVGHIGKSVYVCDDSYVHHWGSLSFNEDGKAFNKSLDENRKKFIDKWKNVEPVLMEKVIGCEQRPVKNKQDLITWQLQ